MTKNPHTMGLWKIYLRVQYFARYSSYGVFGVESGPRSTSSRAAPANDTKTLRPSRGALPVPPINLAHLAIAPSHLRVCASFSAVG
jgi:hypothetical protein